jgi:2'-5' RNA ligase
VAQPDYSDGSMIALYPPPALAASLALPDGLEPSDLHLTIAYTGKAADVDAEALAKAASAIAAATAGPITATIAGHARLPQDDIDVIVALVDSPQLDDLRRTAVEQLADLGIPAAANHSFLAHISIAVIGHDDPDPIGRLPAQPVTFTALTAQHGEDSTAYPLADIADIAREAYAAGWALSGGPWTERVQAGAVAAVETAREFADDPHILEATLNIGKLAGTWALFFARREKLTDEHTAIVLKAWQAIGSELKPGPVIDRLRAEVGTGLPADSVQQEFLRTLTGSASASLLAGIYAHDGHNDLQDAVQDALRSAMAEGKAGVLALHAEKHGHVVEAEGKTYSFDAAYQAIYDQLASMPALTLLAQEWVQRMIGGAARDIGALLARLFTEGATRAEMLSELTSAIQADEAAGSASARSVSLFLNQAMAQAMSQASLDLYASEGTAQASYITAGDGRVCYGCSDYEDGSPYPVDQCPVPGWHPLCRCVVAPVDDVAPYKALAALLA